MPAKLRVGWVIELNPPVKTKISPAWFPIVTLPVLESVTALVTVEVPSLPPLNTNNTYIKSLANWIKIMNDTINEQDESNKKIWNDFKNKHKTYFN